MHFFSSTSSEGLPLTSAGRIAATGQRHHRRALADVGHQVVVDLGGLVCCDDRDVGLAAAVDLAATGRHMCAVGMSSRTNSL
jgi:hypothetical protein